jgi:hypothetical protein
MTNGQQQCSNRTTFWDARIKPVAAVAAVLTGAGAATLNGVSFAVVGFTLIALVVVGIAVFLWWFAGGESKPGPSFSKRQVLGWRVVSVLFAVGAFAAVVGYLYRLIR